MNIKGVILMKKYLLFSLFLIILVSTSSVQAVSVVLPNNLNLPTYDQSFINFNSVNTGYTVLTFIKPEINI